MRRILSSFLVALLVSAALPLTVLGATQALCWDRDDQRGHGGHDHLTARDQSNGLPITLFTTARRPRHGRGARTDHLRTRGRPSLPLRCAVHARRQLQRHRHVQLHCDGPGRPGHGDDHDHDRRGQRAPACAGDSSSGNEDTDQAGTVACTDIDGSPLTYSKVAGPAHGAATVNANGSWTYTPAANYHGSDSFTFRANDGTANSGTVTMSLTIPAVNDAPACADDSASATRTSSRRAPSCAPTSTTPTSRSPRCPGPSHGSASVATDGDWTYTPTTNYSGSDAFTFRANDGSVELEPTRRCS